MTVVFNSTWDGIFEGAPADNENINLGAARIRDFKIAVHQRLAVDHSWDGDGNDGKHDKVTLRVRSGSLPLDASDAALWGQTFGNNTELMFQDSSGRTLQLTSVGALNVPSAFPSGTQMVFLQAFAPPGWVQNTSLHDFLLRTVNNNSGGSVGGAWAITGLGASTIVNGHNLTTAELPSHTHNLSSVVTPVGGNIAFGNANPFVSLAQQTLTTDGGTGGGAPHTHAAGTTVSGDGSWRPAYVNTLMAIKQ